MPMQGRTLYDQNGKAIGIACSRVSTPKCSVCKSRPGTQLCDFAPIGSGKTCDAALCRACAKHPRPGVDHCPKHSEATR